MEGKGFIEAQFLLAGDSLRLATGKEATVEEVWQVFSSRVESMEWG